MLSKSLHSIDLIFNSKREDLVKRLREGNAAWEQRKKQYPKEGLTRDSVLAETSRIQGSRKARKGLAKDSEYAPRLTINDLLQCAEDTRREREAGFCTHHRLQSSPAGFPSQDSWYSVGSNCVSGRYRSEGQEIHGPASITMMRVLSVLSWIPDLEWEHTKNFEIYFC